MRKISLSIFCGILAISPAWAFRPPTDTRHGITLTIADFSDTSTKSGINVRKVPTDKPLQFTITLKNASAAPVQGNLTVWLNDDWTVSPVTEALSVDPGKSATTTHTATATPRVLSALYPVHATFTFTSGGENVTLHPIAIFEAVKPPDAATRAAQIKTITGDGILRLDKIDSWSAIVRNITTTDLGINFSGSDQASGTQSTKGANTRNGIQRPGFAVHPPWRNGPGITWTAFALALPKDKPATLQFHTAIRDSHPDEPQSDGVEFKVFVAGADRQERELFTRFSAAKDWEAATVDLTPYAGQEIILRLWTGPGPHHNTTCDQAYWGDPVIVVGEQSAPPTEAQWVEREKTASTFASGVVFFGGDRIQEKTFKLNVNGDIFGAAIVLGNQGLTDGVITFSDSTSVVSYRGFLCDVDHAAIGAVENGQPVQRVDVATRDGALIISHHVARPEGAFVARATITADRGALRIAWDMPGTTRDARGTPRYTRLALGTCNLPVHRTYAGLGSVVENPGPFTLAAEGFRLSTRHVAADYPNGLSLLQATDIYPTQAVHVPPHRRFGLEAAHDTTFTLIPSAKGAFHAARAFRDISGYTRAPGMDALAGRMCIDQWAGDYRDAANGLREAARYGLTNSVFVKHVWQRWGYDYRLPEIYPPHGDPDAFNDMRAAARDTGILFCPHDNYIDFYPDAENYTYDHICFTENAQPQRAWYNEGTGALSYRWLPHAFRPPMENNMRLMRDGFRPDALFIDVFTAIAPFDYYDRHGTFHPRTRTATEWSAAFDTCRAILNPTAPMISEAGTDALIGHVDAAQSDHFHPSRLYDTYTAAERTPWHDMATHGRMTLFAGGLGPRYADIDWNTPDNNARHGYASDDYLSNTVIGGRNPMCDGPFSRRTVMTYWLLHDVCAALAAQPLDTHQFGDTIHQQHTTFGTHSHVWANRGSNHTWRVTDNIHLPQYGFYAQTPTATAGVITRDGHRIAFAKTPGTFFADARPPFNPSGRERLETHVKDGRHTGNGTFDITAQFTVFEPIPDYRLFVHICNPALTPEGEHITFQANAPLDPARLTQPGPFDHTIPITIPPHLPPGTYAIRYGLYRPADGHRLSIAGHQDGTHRIKGGTLRIVKDADGTPQGSYTPDATDTDGLNTAGAILDFGGITTDGAFRLQHGNAATWQLTPLPGSRPFTATLHLPSLGAGNRKVKAIQQLDPLNTLALPPEWTQTADTLTLTCDGRSFAYTITFE